MAHYFRTKTLFSFLSLQNSRLSPHDQSSFNNLLIGLYQNGVFVNPQNLGKRLIEIETCSMFIPLDGPASQAQIEKIRNIFSQKYPFTKSLTNEELFYLGNLAK
jgi:hypothetical protein